jgi:alpha-tubulin N-acetyltransferase 1
MCKDNTAFGFIKIGKKNLFIRNQAGTIKEISPICVLDFYVHESQQRSGFGKVI